MWGKAGWLSKAKARALPGRLGMAAVVRGELGAAVGALASLSRMAVPVQARAHMGYLGGPRSSGCGSSELSLVSSENQEAWEPNAKLHVYDYSFPPPSIQGPDPPPAWGKLSSQPPGFFQKTHSIEFLWGAGWHSPQLLEMVGLVLLGHFSELRDYSNSFCPPE